MVHAVYAINALIGAGVANNRVNGVNRVLEEQHNMADYLKIARAAGVQSWCGGRGPGAAPRTRRTVPCAEGVMNYAEESAHRGFPMAAITEDLRRLCEGIRAINRAAEGASQ